MCSVDFDLIAKRLLWHTFHITNRSNVRICVCCFFSFNHHALSPSIEIAQGLNRENPVYSMSTFNSNKQFQSRNCEKWSWVYFPWLDLTYSRWAWSVWSMMKLFEEPGDDRSKGKTNISTQMVASVGGRAAMCMSALLRRHSTLLLIRSPEFPPWFLSKNVRTWEPFLIDCHVQQNAATLPY